MNSPFLSNSIDDTANFAEKIITRLNGVNVIALTGSLGSGKTTFSQDVGKVLGVERMVSPTYILLRQYDLKKASPFNNLYHADLYRLSTKEEVFDLGLPEIWSDPKNLLLIEWPEKVLDLLPPHLLINFKKTINDQREITFSYL